MKFTGDDGAEFEEVTRYDGVANRNIVIRPVKQESKWELDGPDSNITDVQYLTLSIDCSKDQAQLIKEAIEALMKYITAYPDLGYWANLTEVADKARQSMIENN